MATLAGLSHAHGGRWDEAKHPRRSDGKFGSGGASSQQARIGAFVRGSDRTKPAARTLPAQRAHSRDDPTRQRLADFIHGRGTRPQQRPARQPASPPQARDSSPLTSEQDVSAYLAGHLADVKYSGPEQLAGLKYSSVLYTDINEDLRGGRDLTHPDTVAALDAAFARTPPLTRPIVVTRGIASAQEILGPPPATGSIIHDKAYTSTSMSGSAVNDRIDGEHDLAVMHITVPKGARVLAFDQPPGGKTAMRSKIPEEREVLLDRGYHSEDDEYAGTEGGTTAGLRIVSDTVVDGRRVIHAELIPRETP